MSQYKYLLVSNALKELADTFEKHAASCDFFIKERKDKYTNETIAYYTNRKSENRETAEELRILSKSYAQKFSDILKDQ